MYVCAFVMLYFESNVDTIDICVAKHLFRSRILIFFRCFFVAIFQCGPSRASSVMLGLGFEKIGKVSTSQKVNLSRFLIDQQSD